MRRQSDLTVEFERLRDSLVEAIHAGKVSRVESCLDVYRAAVQAFLEKLREFGAVYDFEAARQEASSIEGGWAEIEWIKNDLRGAIDAAFKGKSDEVLRKVIFFPLSLALRALQEGNYYVFEQFLWWMGFSYQKSRERPGQREQRDTIELIATFFRDMSDYSIEPQFRYAATAEEIKRHAEFSRGVILVLSQLLKAAFDNRDLFGFRVFAETLSALFEGLRREGGEGDEELLRWRLQQGNVAPQEHEEIQEKLDLARRVRQASAEVDRTRNEAFFGMGAWIVQKHLATEEGVTEVRSYCDVIRVSIEIGPLTALYYDLSKKRVGERVFGWEAWIMEEAPRRQVVSINFDYYLSRFYVLKALEALRGVSHEAGAAIELPLNDDLEFLAGREDGELQRAIKEIEERKEKLGPLVDSSQIDAIPVFREILARAVARQKTKEADELIAAPLDTPKVRGFISNVVREWRRGAVVRAIVEGYGNTKTGGEAPEGLGYYGFNVIDRKDVYVAGSRVHASDWGTEHGRSIAATENQLVMGLISKAIRERNVGRGRVDAVGQIDQAIRELSETHTPNVVILSSAWHVATQLRQAESFRASEPQGVGARDFVGFYRDIPVFQVHGRGERGRVYTLDLKRLGTWWQYSPRRVFPDEEIVGVFSFYLRAYDEVGARELLRKRPKLATDSDTGQRLEAAEALRQLQQRVHLRILEQFEYRVDDSAAGIRMTLPREL